MDGGLENLSHYDEQRTTQCGRLHKKIAMLSPMFSFAILFLGNGDWDNLLFYPPVGTLIYTHWENGQLRETKQEQSWKVGMFLATGVGRPRKWGDRCESDDLYVLIL
jgi:hypothetical protein